MLQFRFFFSKKTICYPAIIQRSEYHIKIRFRRNIHNYGLKVFAVIYRSSDSIIDICYLEITFQIF